MQDALRRPVSKDITNQSSSENWFEKRQLSETAESRHGSGLRRLDSGSFQHSRGISSLQIDADQKGDRAKQTGKPLKRINVSSPHNKRNRSTPDRSKRGYNANRPPKPEERPKSEFTQSSTFEVKPSDFPELSDPTPNKTKSPISQEPLHWGAAKSPLHQSSRAPSKDKAGNKGLKPNSTPQVTLIEKSERARSDQEFELVLPNPHGSPAASWATIASQPPKVIQKIPTTCGASSQKETHKKNKKKDKRKSNTVSKNQEDVADSKPVQLLPPKFEDEEEFPDLSSAFIIPNKGPKQTADSVIQERTLIPEKDGSAVQLENPHKRKITDEKSGSTASKKGQASQKKSKVPVQLDLGNMLMVLEQKHQSQKSKHDVKTITLSVGGALPVVHKEPAVQKKHPWKQERVAHNPLDSTSPLVKKGKQREVPKAKKPSPLKKIILKEREERKQNRLLEERDPTLMISEVDEETLVSENPSETTTEQPTHESSSDQSSIEDGEQTCSQITKPAQINSAEENTSANSCSPAPKPSLPKIHSRKFRDYCSQMLSKDVDECVTTLLKELVRFQDRLYQKDPMKARMKRRLVMGLREVLKHLKLRKVKCVIISPNCERVQSKGGLDDALHTIIDTCREQEVPFVFALSRKSLGRCVSKAVPVSLVGIFNYDGAQDHYHKMIELTSQARQAYEEMVINLEANVQEQEGENEDEQETEPQAEPPEAEEPEYIKVWKKMLEKDYNHKFLPLEEQFSSMAISQDSNTHLNDQEGS